MRARATQLLEKQGAAVIPELETLLDDPNPFYQARAIWLLAGMGTPGMEKIKPFLELDNPELVLTTVRALAAYDPDALLLAAKSRLSDADPLVRRELAILLRHMDYEKTREVYAALIDDYDGKDPWYRNALGIGLKERANEVFEVEWQGLDPLKWSPAQASLIWELHPVSAVPALKLRVQSETLSSEEKVRAFETLAFIPHKQAAEVFLELAGQEGNLAEQARWWLQFRKYNEWQAYLEDWEPPLDNLPSGQPALLASLAWLSDSLATKTQQQEALTSLAESPEGRLHLAMLAVKGSFPDSLKAKLPATWTAEGRPAVKHLLVQYFGAAQDVKEVEVNELQGDAAVGKIKAAQNCLACHRIGDTGNDIGPNLSGISQKMDAPTLVNAMVQPDAAIGFGSEAWLVRLKNGAVLYGLLQSDGPVVTVLDSQGQRFVIPASEVAEKRRVPVSLMPKPTEMGLAAQDLADIRAYLMQGDL